MTTTELPPETSVEEPNPDGAGNGNPDGNMPREQRYRLERNEARERITRLQNREVERLASKHLSNPADLLTLGGVGLADLLDDSGDVDPEKVNTLATEVLGTRPGLRAVEAAVDRSQGHGNADARREPSWANLLER